MNVFKNYYNTQYNSPFDMKVDNELVDFIAKDPSSIDFFSKQSPMLNLLLRTKCQVALWDVVYRLRNNNVYAKSQDLYDPISGFMSVLEQYPLTIFDDMNIYAYNNPVSVLKKLLAVFSYRQVMFKYENDGGMYLPKENAIPVVPLQFLGATFATQSTINIPYFYSDDKNNTVRKLTNANDVIIEKRSPVYKKRSLWDAGLRVFVSINLFNDNSMMSAALTTGDVVYTTPTPKDTTITIASNDEKDSTILDIGRDTNKKLNWTGGLRYVKSPNGSFNLECYIINAVTPVAAASPVPARLDPTDVTVYTPYNPLLNGANKTEVAKTGPSTGNYNQYTSVIMYTLK